MTNGRIRYCGLILRAALAKITVVGTSNCLNYCAVYIVRLYIKFTNVAAGRMKQPGGSRVRYPHRNSSH